MLWKRHPAPTPIPDSAEWGELDAITLRRAQRGERSAQAALVVCYSRRITALVGRILIAVPDLVDDTVQDTFVRILGALDRFDATAATRLSTWALTVATRVSIDRLRRLRTERRFRADNEVEVTPSGPGGGRPERRAEARQLGARVESAMADLPDDQRAVLVLRGYHDLDYAEIAEALDIEVGTVKSRLARAREALRTAMGES